MLRVSRCVSVIYLVRCEESFRVILSLLCSSCSPSSTNNNNPPTTNQVFFAATQSNQLLFPHYLITYARWTLTVYRSTACNDEEGVNDAKLSSAASPPSEREAKNPRRSLKAATRGQSSDLRDAEGVMVSRLSFEAMVVENANVLFKPQQIPSFSMISLTLRL